MTVEKLPGEVEELQKKAQEIEKKAETANSLMQEFADDDTLGKFYQEKFQEYTEALKTIDARLKAIKEEQGEEIPPQEKQEEEDENAGEEPEEREEE